MIVGGGWGIVGGIKAVVLASFTRDEIAALLDNSTRDEIAELAGRTLPALGGRAVPFAAGLLEMIAEEKS